MKAFCCIRLGDQDYFLFAKSDPEAFYYYASEIDLGPASGYSAESLPAGSLSFDTPSFLIEKLASLHPDDLGAADQKRLLDLLQNLAEC